MAGPRNDKTPASRRGSHWFSVALARLPPRSSVLPPGDTTDKAVKPDKERAKKGERRYLDGSRVVQGQVRASAIRRDHDGDRAAILAVEQTQVRLRELPWAAKADGGSGSLPAFVNSATTFTAPGRTGSRTVARACRRDRPGRWLRTLTDSAPRDVAYCPQPPAGPSPPRGPSRAAPVPPSPDAATPVPRSPRRPPKVSFPLVALAARRPGREEARVCRGPQKAPRGRQVDSPLFGPCHPLGAHDRRPRGVR